MPPGERVAVGVFGYGGNPADRTRHGDAPAHHADAVGHQCARVPHEATAPVSANACISRPTRLECDYPTRPVASPRAGGVASPLVSGIGDLHFGTYCNQ